MQKLCLVSSLILFGATWAPAFAAEKSVAPPTSWLSQVSAYQWRSPLGATEAGDTVSRGKTRAVELFFRGVDPAQSARFLRHHDGATSRGGVFGSLTQFPIQAAPAPSLSLRRLMKIGSERQSREDLFGPQGSLSVSNASRSLADPEMIVRGVNDDESTSTDQSAQEINDQRLATETPSLPTNPDGRRRIVDASEGTRLDPLLNTTYDLNYPKTVPSLKELSGYLPSGPAK